MIKSFKIKINRRLKIIEGQIKGVQKMVENDEYCINILVQTMAIKNAISSVEDLVLKNHLETHVIKQMNGGEQKKAINEILSVYKLSKKK